MKLNLKKTRLAIAVFVLSFSSAKSHALIPTTDIANLVEGMLGNIQELYNWLEEQALMEVEMQLQTTLMGEEMDANNNATARMITSINKAQQDIQNTEIIRMFAPAGTACSTVALGATMDDIYCSTSQSTEEARARRHARENTYSLEPMAQKKSQEEAAKTIVDECRPNSNGESGCLKTEYLLGSLPAQATTAQKQQIEEDTERQIELITGPIPAIKTDPRIGDSPTGNAMRVKDYRLQALKSVATESLMAVRSAYLAPSDAPGSEMQSLWAFVDKRWGDGDSDFIKKITNTHPQKTSGAQFITTPEQVLREIGVMQAFQSYMMVLQYEQSLRAEAVEASLLSLETEPLR